jgi:hypothetical protein
VKTRAITLALVVVLSSYLALAEAPSDNRFQWSSDEFALACGFKWADFLSADRKWFSDGNYSDKWRPTDLDKLNECDDCYRFADVAQVGPTKRVVRLTLSSESGDWRHEITYCFDNNGALRSVRTVFNCAWGWSLVRVYSFRGTALKLQESRWQGLSNGKTISRPNSAVEIKHLWSDVPTYTSISKLPFAGLMTGINAQTN